jgi:hypothetical protein
VAQDIVAAGYVLCSEGGVSRVGRILLKLGGGVSGVKTYNIIKGAT